MMDPHSEQAEHVYQLTNYFFIGAAFIMLVVCVLTFLFLYRYRAKPGDKEPVPIFNNRRIEWLIIGVPLAMVTLFFVLTLRTMREVLPVAGNHPPDVIVTGHQWWWQVYYPEANVTAANEIHLPAGKKIMIRLLSADVIHDWWVPQLGNKMDVVPGRENHLWLTIKEPGYYEGACSEFCGQQHAWMRIRVYAESESAFQQWLSAQQQKASAPQGQMAALGAAVFHQKTCGSCHRIAGTDAAGEAGPDLTHFASRRTLLTGMMHNTPENVDRWLKHPQKIKPGAYMPDFLLDDKSRKALVAYLMQLK